MNRYLTILLLLSIQLFALKEDIKVSIKIDNNIVNVKALFRSKMYGPKYIDKLYEKNYIKTKIEPEYITRIIALVSEKIVYDIQTTPNISKNPYIKFQFKDNKEDETIKFITIDNKRNQKSKCYKIHQRNTSVKCESTTKHLSLGSKQIKSKILKANTPEKAIKELYGKTNYIKDKIDIKMPSLSEDLGKVQITIQSAIDLESIAVFNNSNPSSTIAIFSVPPDGIINYFLKARMARVCHINITVVGKDRNGNIYKTEKELVWGGGDIQCTGYNTIGGNGGGG